MSNESKIQVNVYDVYSVEQLQVFADANGITLQKAESVAHELLWRRVYAKRYNAAPEQKAKRQAYNKQRNMLRKALNA